MKELKLLKFKCLKDWKISNEWILQITLRVKNILKDLKNLENKKNLKVWSFEIIQKTLELFCCYKKMAKKVKNKVLGSYKLTESKNRFNRFGLNLNWVQGLSPWIVFEFWKGVGVENYEIKSMKFFRLQKKYRY